MKKKFAIAVLLIGFVMIGASCRSTKDGGLFRSTDQAESWEQKVFVNKVKRKVYSIAGVDVQTIQFDPQQHAVLYIGTKGSGVYKTENGGDQWKLLSIAPDRIRDVEVDPQDSNNIFAVKNSNILRSTNAGNDWEIVYTDTQNAIITQVEVDQSSSSRVFATTSIGTVLLSEDGGVNWKVTYQVNEPITQLFIDPYTSTTLYVLELDKAIHRSADGGVTWLNLMTGESTADAVAADGVQVKKVKPPFFDENQGARKVKTMTIDPNNSALIYAASPAGLLKTTDAGTTWLFVNTLIERGAAQNASIKNITVLPGNSDILFFTVGRLIHKTTDNGATWKTIENFPSGRLITAFVIDSENPDLFYAGVEAVKEEQSAFFSAPK